MLQLHLRLAIPEDVAYLTQLRLRTIHEHICKAGTNLSFEEHELRALTRLESCRILSVGDQIAGMIKVIQTPGSWTIEQLQVEPYFQGKGIGTQVVRQVQRNAKLEGARLLLGVLKANPALKLYERIGFVALREVDGIIEMESAA